MTLTRSGATAAAARPPFCCATPFSDTPVSTASRMPSEKKSHERSRIYRLLVVRDRDDRVRERVERAVLAGIGAAEEAAPITLHGSARDRALVDRERRDREEM